MNQTFKLLSFILLCGISALVTASFAGDYIITLKEGDRVIITAEKSNDENNNEGEGNTTQPVPPDDFSLTEIESSQFVVKLNRPATTLVKVVISTKAGEVGSPFIEIGQDSFTLQGTPNWEYFVTVFDIQRVIHLSPVINPIPPTWTLNLPEWTKLPAVNATYVVTDNVNTAQKEINAGRGVVLQNAIVNNQMLTLNKAKNVWIQNCTFTTPTGGWGTGHSIRLIGRNENINIINNTFLGPNGDAAIAAGNWKSADDFKEVRITHNDFLNSSEGIHFFSRIGGDSQIFVYRNYFRGIRRIGIELQEGGKDCYVLQNYYHKPWVKSNGMVVGPTVFGLSIATVETDNVVVKQNIVIGDSPNNINVDADRLGMAIEVAGRTLVATENEIYGNFICGLSVLSGHSDSVKTKANLTKNTIKGILPKMGGWGAPIFNDGGSVITQSDNTIESSVDFTKSPVRDPLIGRQ
jgi:hypothetical protein